MNVIFITGNEHKARILADFLGEDVAHQKIDLDEIQSLDTHEIVEHKVRQAYERIKSPVLVEDVALTFEALGKLPGPFIKWFIEAIGLEGMCRMLDAYETRKATARIVFAYYDGTKVSFFDGQVKGSIADNPRGESFGWNPLFIPDGSDKTYAEMDDFEMIKYSLRTTTVFPQIKQFLRSLDKMN